MSQISGDNFESSYDSYYLSREKRNRENEECIQEEFGDEVLEVFKKSKIINYVDLSSERIKDWLFSLVKFSPYFLELSSNDIESTKVIYANGELGNKVELLSVLSAEMKKKGEKFYVETLLHAPKEFISVVLEHNCNNSVKLAAFELGFNYFDHFDVDVLNEFLDFLEHSVFPIILEFDISSEVKSLLSKRLSFLKTLHDTLSEEQWSGLLRDKESAEHISLYLDSSEKEMVISNENYEKLNKQETVLVSVENSESEELSKSKQEIEDIIDVIGLDVLLSKVCLGLKVVYPDAGFNHSGGYLFLTNKIEIGAISGKHYDFLPTLLHEIGHGVKNLANSDREGSEKIEQYYVAIALEPKGLSSYAESFKLSEQDDMSTYIDESFAEDFLIYFCAPERLSVLRKKAMENIVENIYQHVDVEKIRKKIRSVLGNYYWKNIEDIMNDIICDTPQNIAEYRDRVDNREKW
ncbi:MAG: hypothetical protein HOE80_03805 [Candidatus Magasanikbacteria bacterium]|jgi:hypothetical protein|nr:hypothetical protein [Candidatus Magasanikbacteria bacterium]MBT4071820.1 hypothetical protein [Candidatus Magasanikbacteria bacterium]